MEIKIDSEVLLDTVLFSAIRYCIGRHSYVVGDAIEFARIIDENREKFNQKRLKFLARDIRCETSKCLELFYDNIHTENAHNDRIEVSAHHLIAEFLEGAAIDFREYEFDTDCEAGRITVRHSDKNKALPITYFGDIEPFEKLADVIDNKFVEVRVEYEGKSEWRKCLPCYEYDPHTNRFEKLYSNYPQRNSYVPKEYIEEEREWESERNE
jgi:hypothetical protein